jgi:hypothetical protein
MLDLNVLPTTSNNDLASVNTPKRLTLAEFEALPVSAEEAQVRRQIYALEQYMHGLEFCHNDKEMEEHGIKPIHRFVNGLYHRELTIPPGQVVVGKRHAIEHIVMLTAGSCLCITERGKEYMTAPMTFISPAGEKRVVMTMEEPCTWVTLHPTTETNLEAIESEVIIAEPERQARYDEVYRLSRSEQMKQVTVSEVA